MIHMTNYDFSLWMPEQVNWSQWSLKFTVLVQLFVGCQSFCSQRKPGVGYDGRPKEGYFVAQDQGTADHGDPIYTSHHRGFPTGDKQIFGSCQRHHSQRYMLQILREETNPHRYCRSDMN